MALSRNFLQALGIESEKVDEIINAHADSIDGLKEQRDKFKAEAEKLSEVQAQLEDAKKQLASLKDGENNPYKEKYEKLKAEFEEHKANQEAKEILEKKTAAYTALLKEIGVSEKRHSSIVKLKSADFDSFELDKEGKIKNSDKLKESIKEEWADFIEVDGKQGADITKPPANNGGLPKQPSRAAQLANQYHTNLYGTIQKED